MGVPPLVLGGGGTGRSRPNRSAPSKPPNASENCCDSRPSISPAMMAIDDEAYTNASFVYATEEAYTNASFVNATEEAYTNASFVYATEEAYTNASFVYAAE